MEYYEGFVDEYSNSTPSRWESAVELSMATRHLRGTPAGRSADMKATRAFSNVHDPHVLYPEGIFPDVIRPDRDTLVLHAMEWIRTLVHNMGLEEEVSEELVQEGMIYYLEKLNSAKDCMEGRYDMEEEEKAQQTADKSAVTENADAFNILAAILEEEGQSSDDISNEWTMLLDQEDSLMDTLSTSTSRRPMILQARDINARMRGMFYCLMQSEYQRKKRTLSLQEVKATLAKELHDEENTNDDTGLVVSLHGIAALIPEKDAGDDPAYDLEWIEAKRKVLRLAKTLLTEKQYEALRGWITLPADQSVTLSDLGKGMGICGAAVQIHVKKAILRLYDAPFSKFPVRPPL